MKPEFKIKYAILADLFTNDDKEISTTLTEDQVEELWD